MRIGPRRSDGVQPGSQHDQERVEVEGGTEAGLCRHAHALDERQDRIGDRDLVIGDVHPRFDPRERLRQHGLAVLHVEPQRAERRTHLTPGDVARRVEHDVLEAREQLRVVRRRDATPTGTKDAHEVGQRARRVDVVEHPERQHHVDRLPGEREEVGVALHRDDASVALVDRAQHARRRVEPDDQTVGGARPRGCRPDAVAAAGIDDDRVRRPRELVHQETVGGRPLGVLAHPAPAIEVGRRLVVLPHRRFEAHRSVGLRHGDRPPRGAGRASRPA